MNQSKGDQNPPKRRKPMSTEAREDQLISLAINLAEKKLLDGTASNQLIVHYLKLGSTKERLEKEMLIEQKKLVTAKTEAIQSAKRVEDLYTEALSAMRDYSGKHDGEEDY